MSEEYELLKEEFRDLFRLFVHTVREHDIKSNIGDAFVFFSAKEMYEKLGFDFKEI